MKNYGAVNDPKDIATKEYVDGKVPSPSAATPLEDGTASAGSSADYARGDHRHPHDPTIPAYASIDANGLITYKHAANGTALFTLQLPLYDGSVSVNA